MLKSVDLDTSPSKKLKVVLQYTDGSTRTVHFGQKGAEDYTTHKDADRKARYHLRHSHGNENWTKTGVGTAGWWSRWLLWSEPSGRKALSRVKAKLGHVKLTVSKKAANYLGV